MRRALAIVLLAAAATAGAPAAAEPARGPRGGDLWRDLLEPHAAEVELVLVHARAAAQVVTDQLQAGDVEWAVDARLRYLREIRHLTRYARRLAPEHPEVLALLGGAADELGRTAEAQAALEAHLRVRGPERASRAALGRLGALYARAGQPERALRTLRLAQGPLRADTAPALVHLAAVLAARGDMAGAIDTLRAALPPALPASLSADQLVIAFALAVHYDRDEQRTAALEVLAHLRAALQDGFAASVRAALAGLRHAAPEDLHYYRALLDEVLGNTTEARAGWALYAASGDAPWRRRALDHLAALDAARTATRRGASASPPAAIRRTVLP